MAKLFNINDIKKYLYGFASQEEEDAILCHPEINGKFGEAWDNFHDIKNKVPSTDFENLFKSVKEQAQLPDKPIYNISDYYDQEGSKWYRNPLSIAASVLILLTIGVASLYLYFTSNSNPVIEVVAEKGQRKELTLPDGTRVWLNSDTKLTYNRDFSDKFREVNLVGEAYFNVVKDSKRPFIVRTSQLSIKVLGTVFNVKSYPNDYTIETTLVAGLVSVQKNEDIKKNLSPVLVKPQQKAVFFYEANDIRVVPVNIDKTTSWRKGKLVFDNETIDGVVNSLERWYGLNIQVLGQYKPSDRFSLTIKDENIEEVINLLQITTPLTFKVKDMDGTNEHVFEPQNVNHDMK